MTARAPLQSGFKQTALRNRDWRSLQGLSAVQAPVSIPAGFAASHLTAALSPTVKVQRVGPAQAEIPVVGGGATILSPVQPDLTTLLILAAVGFGLAYMWTK